MSTIVSFILAVASLFGAIAMLYASWIIGLVRRWQLPEPLVERLVVELPTPGHHIALHHHPAASPRWHEPVILCHGLAANRFNLDFFEDGDGRDRSSLARALARRGFDVWVLETRGHGWAEVPRRSRWTVFDEVREDVPTAIETVLNVTGRERVFWVGHSWGGLLQLLLQASKGPRADRVAGIVALGTPGRFESDSILDRFRRWSQWLDRLGAVRLPLRFFAQLALPWVDLLNWWVQRRWPHLAPLSPKLVRHLLTSLAEDIPPGIVAQIRTWARLGHPVDPKGRPIAWAAVRTPLLLVAGAQDWLAPPEAVRVIAENAGSEDLRLEVLGRAQGYRHDYGHGGLVLAEPSPDVVFPLIGDWIEARAQALPVEAGGGPAREPRDAAQGTG